MSKRCSAKNKSGNRCGAWSAAGRDKCALHLDPERPAEIGSKHGRELHFRTYQMRATSRTGHCKYGGGG